MKFQNTLLSAAILAAGASQLFAANIVNVSTGLGAGNVRITTGNTPDANWTVDQIDAGPAPAIVTTPSDTNWYGGWVDNGPASDWIARTSTDTNNGSGPYTFHNTFDLTGYDLSTVGLSGVWAIDDQGTLDLNGNLVATLGNGAWTGLTAFSIDTGSPFFNQGLNTLNITITSDDNYLEAVRLGGIVTGDLSGAPEPSTTFLLLGGFAAAALKLRRKTA